MSFKHIKTVHYQGVAQAVKEEVSLKVNDNTVVAFMKWILTLNLSYLRPCSEQQYDLIN